MIVGTTIFKMDGNSYYTPEFPRGGRVEHRNEDDTTWSTAGTFSTITATGVGTPLDVTGIKEIVRLKFDFDAGDAATDGIHFFLPAPAWRPYP